MSAMPPASGERDECMALTEPLEASVVTLAQRTDGVTPKRSSLPSIMRRAAPGDLYSLQSDRPSMTTRKPVMTPKSTQAWRRAPVRRPKA